MHEPQGTDFVGVGGSLPCAHRMNLELHSQAVKAGRGFNYSMQVANSPWASLHFRVFGGVDLKYQKGKEHTGRRI